MREEGEDADLVMVLLKPFFLFLESVV